MTLIKCSKILGGAFATISFLGSGVGIGIVFAGLILGVAYRPEKEELFFKYAILGFALTEAVALFGLMMAFLIIFTL